MSEGARPKKTYQYRSLRILHGSEVLRIVSLKSKTYRPPAKIVHPLKTCPMPDLSGSRSVEGNLR